MAIVRLTSRALHDFKEIEQYTIKHWDKKTANRYLDDFDNALSLLKKEPELLQLIPEFSQSLMFYRVRSHFMVCDRIGDVIYVITVFHGSMDILQRLNELEPSLKNEVTLLHDRLNKK